MTEYHYLIADDALRASHNMEAAVEQFSRTTDALILALERHNEHMARLTDALTTSKG